MKYIYLFPDEPAMGHYQYECRRFGCEYLGKNRFQSERNIVIKGELSDLKRYAKWLDYDLHPDYLYKEDDFAGDITDACKDDEIEGIYECKNNEVIEVRYDDKYKDYRFTFQKGGSPIILPKEEGKKLLRQYQAVKYQDSCKDATMEQEEKLHDILESQWTYLGNKGHEQVWQYTRPGYFPEKVRALRNIAPDLISYEDILDKKVYIKEPSTYDSVKDSRVEILVTNAATAQRICAKSSVQLKMVDYDYKSKGYRVSLNGDKNRINVALDDLDMAGILIEYPIYWEDSCKDETPYQKQEESLHKELKKMDSIHKAIKAYKKFQKDALVKVPENIKREFEQVLTSNGLFKIVSKSPNIFSDTHYQIISNKQYLASDFDRIVKQMTSLINKFEDKYHQAGARHSDIPVTWNFGYQKDGYISAGIDLDKMWVEDSVKDSIVKDSAASSAINEIKSKYSGLKFYDIKYADRGSYVLFRFYISGNLPENLDRFDHTWKAPFERFVKYVLEKHGFDDVSVDTGNKNGQLFVYVVATGEKDELKDSVKDEIKVGSKVKVKVAHKQPIGIVKKIRGDVAEVEYTASSGINRIDQYYLSDLELNDACKDAVSLRKGDWFIKNNLIRRNFADIYLYKVIDDKLQSRNGFAPSLVAEEYYLDTINLRYGGYDKLQKQGTTTLSPRDIENITVFNSAEEAFKWLKTRIAAIKSVSEK